ncbi:MAG: DUF1343 domain-containing protein [Opitutales bacterium]
MSAESLSEPVAKVIRLLPLSCLLALCAACNPSATGSASNPRTQEPARSVGEAPNRSPAASGFRLGIDVLAAEGFSRLRGSRVGLLTHPAGVNRHGESTIDVLRRAPGVQLTALFGPEHGIYGDEAANVPVLDKTDSRTGLPVYSLYGKFRKPTPAMLAGIDVLVIDLQDLGVRSYTYISSMKLAVEACFEQDKRVVILDRPNPLGGLKVDGPRLEERWKSYVGAFPIPYVHGLTIGELALMTVREGWLDLDAATTRRGRLAVVRMAGWRRGMQWPATGLDWIATSPNIPDLSSVLGYAMTGLGAQLGGFTHGIGTQHPFRLLRFRGKTPGELKAALDAAKIPGLDFRIIDSRTRSGAVVRGVFPVLADWQTVRPTELSFHLMRLAAAWSPTNPFAAATDAQRVLFNKHVGSSAWWTEISRRGADADVDAFVEAWSADARAFQERARRYWLYR